jgi:restriction system protein
MPSLTFADAMLPILEQVADGAAHPWREVRAACLAVFDAADDQLAIERGIRGIKSRTRWASTHLLQAGLVTRPQRGHLQITVRGKEVLAEKPARIDVGLLSKYPEYQLFRSRAKAVIESPAEEPVGAADNRTPFDVIESAIAEVNAALTDELLQRVRDELPEFLEQLVLKLLSAMGYGGRAGASAEHLGGSEDGGVDGVVWQDVLGLDRVYIQAKRYAAGKTVGRPDIQAFVGALHGHGADSGVFITTSSFSGAAIAYADKIPYRIVLIDGQRLAELMILHNVGVQVESTFVLRQLDEDFFEQ